jgi:hypothetical protein
LDWIGCALAGSRHKEIQNAIVGIADGRRRQPGALATLSRLRGEVPAACDNHGPAEPETRLSGDMNSCHNGKQ